MIHKLLLVLFILLMPLSVFADLDSISISMYQMPDADAGSNTNLHFPRYQLMPGSGRDTIVYLGYGNPDPFHISYDGGVTWAFFSGGSAVTDYGGDHQHGFILNDTIYISNRAGYTDSLSMSVLDVKARTMLYDRAYYGLGVDANSAYGTGALVKFNGLLIGVARSFDWNLRYVITDDWFSTQTDGYIVDYTSSIGGSDTRIGMAPMFGGNTLMAYVWLNQGVDTLDIFTFDPSDSSWTRETNPPLTHNNLERYFSVNSFNDTALMVATFELNSDDTLYTSWRGQNSDTWTVVKAVENPNTGAEQSCAALVYVDSIDVLCLFYLYNNGLYMKYWRDNFTWSSEYTIVPPDSNLDHPQMAIPQIVPSTHGPKAYITVTPNSNHVLFVSVKLWETASLSQSWSVTDTGATTLDFENEYGGTSGTVDYIKVIYSTTNDITDGSRDSVQQTSALESPDTLQVTGLEQATKYYWWGIIQDDNGADTVNVDSVTTLQTTHTWTKIDSTSTSFKAQIVFDNYTSPISIFKLIYASNNDITDDGRDSVMKEDNFGSPDTLQATGLTADTKYFWWGVFSDGGFTDTTSVDSVLTLTTPNPLDDIQGPSKIEGFIIVQ